MFVFIRGIENPADFWFVFIREIKNRIGINFIRPLMWPFVRRMLLRSYTGDLKNGVFSIRSTTGVAVCGAYAVAPYTGDLKNGDFSIHSTTGVAVCGAYAIRPYTGTRKNGDFSIRSASGVAVYGTYAVAPYTGTRKNGDFSFRSTTGVAVCGAYAIRPYTDRRKLGWFLVRFYPMKGKMAGDSMIRHPRKGVWGCPILVVRFLDHMPGLHFEVAVDDIDG